MLLGPDHLGRCWRRARCSSRSAWWCSAWRSAWSAPTCRPGQQRFTFGIPELSDGIGFVAIAMGMFGIAEIILNLERPEARSVLKTKVGSLC
jgi:hypothetical protein